jgi:hypothetical protein
MVLLACENIVDPSRAADVEASWDRAIAPETMILTIGETIAPARRIGAATRQRVREAQHRRWAALRASVVSEPPEGICQIISIMGSIDIAWLRRGGTCYVGYSGSL